MAQLLNTETNKTELLNQYHVLGRNALICHTILADKDSSKLHATIFFKNNKWYLQDHSRNGTLIDNSYTHQKTIELKLHQKIKFSQQSDDFWQVVNLDIPCSYLQNKKDKSVIKLDKGVFLLEDEDVHQMMYTTADKEWVLENEEGAKRLFDGDLIVYKNEFWVFVKNDILEDTLDYGSIINNMVLIIELSLNYEHVRITLSVNDRKYSLGSKSQHLVWYLLAKQVKEDQIAELEASERGWVDNENLIAMLSRELGKELDVYYLNLQIYRIRKQLLELEPYGPLMSNVIERRKGQVRLNHKDIVLKEPQTTSSSVKNS